MKIAGVLLGTAALLFAVLIGQARAEFVVNLQGAAVFTGNNDVRIPGNGGTDIPFSDDLAADAREELGRRADVTHDREQHVLGAALRHPEGVPGEPERPGRRDSPLRHEVDQRHDLVAGVETRF